MFEQERERGVRLARLSRMERDELVAKLMFGRHWDKAKDAMVMLMHAWGISETGPAVVRGANEHE
jgi:hypothetical protein